MYNYHNAFSSKIIMVINWWHGPRSINNWDIINQFSLTRISYLDSFHALNTSFVKTSIFCGIIINWFRFRTVLLRECTLFLVPLASCAGGCHENRLFLFFSYLFKHFHSFQLYYCCEKLFILSTFCCIFCFWLS